MDVLNWDWPPYAEWLAVSEAAVAAVALTTLGVYIAVILLTRLAGLRSFSKMSSFDFAITVAIGSVVASTVVLQSVSLLKGAVTLAALYTAQFGVAVLRERFSVVNSVVDNEPLLLMAGQEVLHDNLRKAHVTEDDVRSKLREANVTRYDQISAVVMEPTGDVSVLHTDPDGPRLDPDLLSGVRGAERLREKMKEEQGGE